jgi:FMN reductase
MGTVPGNSLPMSALRLVGISGNTQRPSRTRALVETLGAEVGRQRAVRFQMLDLVDAGTGIAAFSRDTLSPEAEAVVAAIEGADALIVGTPVYKGSYAGLFKHLFDFVDPAALAGRPVILAATGGGRRHALVIEHQLRPLFGFFSALALPTSVYASNEDFTDGVLTDPVTLARIDQAAAEMATHATARPTLARLQNVA